MTRREAEVLDLLKQGMSTHAIAARLGVADVTVRRHRSSLLAKFGVHRAGDVVRLLADAELTPH